MKKTIVSIAFIVCSVVSSVAFARPDVANMTCSYAQALVESKGAIVLSTGGQHLYNRFVVHGGYCLMGEVTRPAWVSTRDSGGCLIGYTCEERQN